MQYFKNRLLFVLCTPRLFYGWWIVAAGFFIIACGLGTISFVLQNLFALVKNLGGTVNQTTTALMIHNIVAVIAVLAIGPLIDRFGPRKLMLIGIPIASIAVLGFSFVHSLLYIHLSILAIGTSVGFFLPVQTATANWFIKRRSLALAVICAAPILGKSMINILGEKIADLFDLLGAFLGLGLVMLLIGIPLALVIRHRPEQYGCLPDGASLPTEKDNTDTEISFTLRQALRTRAFWMLTIAMGLAAGVSTAAEGIGQPYLISERGFDLRTTINIFRLAPLMGLVWMLLFGFLGDKFPKRYLLAFVSALQGLSMVILMAMGSINQLYLYMLVCGFSSAIGPLALAIRADYFGRKKFATIFAVMGLASVILSVGFPPLFRLMQTNTGSYRPVLLLSMTLGFLGAVVFLFTKSPGVTKPEGS